MIANSTYIKNIGSGVQSVVGLYQYKDGYLAIKNVIPMNGSISDGAIKELSALIKLKDCSHIVQVLDVRIDVKDYTVKIAMPLYDGNLTKLFKQLQYIELIDQLIIALSDLHTNAIIHRDIKPENILFNYEPFSVYLADFGQSLQLPCDNKEVLSDIYYAPYYRAPELLVSDDVLQATYDYKTDIWALGIVLIEYLTGELITEVVTYDEIKLRIEKLTINGRIDFENELIANMLYIDPKLRSIEFVNGCKNNLVKGVNTLSMSEFYQAVNKLINGCDFLSLDVTRAILALNLFERYSNKSSRVDALVAACVSLVNKAMDFDIINFRDLTDTFNVSNDDLKFMEGLVFKNVHYQIINCETYELFDYIKDYNILRKTYSAMAKDRVYSGQVDILAWTFEVLQGF